ncbi:hypothetical protein C0995_007737 [Termitomyces sp. Mi166|nr:hypothetical protein C0995_007737 [Termitomyces sp. Mi166\
MSSNAEVLVEVGQDFNLKVARVVAGAICYGTVPVFNRYENFSQHGLKTRISNIFLLAVTILMFFGGTIFLSIDASDLVRRIQVIMINNPDQSLQEKLDRADDQLKKLTWTGEMLFIFMVNWTEYHRIEANVASVYELGCDVQTHWAINDLTPTAASVGAAKLHRKLMSKYLGDARRKTAVEKILTLLIESGFIYIVIYTLQAVPIYKAKLSPAGLFVFNVVNAVIQQAMGMYPTVIIILVRMHKSLWDTREISQGIYSATMKFRAGASSAEQTDATAAVSSSN